MGFAPKGGAFASHLCLSADIAWKVPAHLSLAEAASVPVVFGTAYHSLHNLARLRRGETVLIHAAAGGVGLLFTQWARLLGVKVIGSVSSDAKAAVATAHGCEHTIVYTREDVATRVREITDGAGVPVVYDSIGRTTYQSSIDSLARRGLLVCFGTASGQVPPINAMELAMKGSLYVTRPALADFIADKDERAALAAELFDHVGAGRIQVEINQRYALDDAVQAHRDLESGHSIGSSVFDLESAA